MIEPTEKDIGRRVLYHPGSGLTLGLPQRGVITSFNATMVFVRYGADTGSKATQREHLQWEIPLGKPVWATCGREESVEGSK